MASYVHFCALRPFQAPSLVNGIGWWGLELAGGGENGFAEGGVPVNTGGESVDAGLCVHRHHHFLD